MDYIDIYPKLSDIDEKAQVAGKCDSRPGALVHKIVADSISEWIDNLPR